jgi:hypothetical protein
MSDDPIDFLIQDAAAKAKSYAARAVQRRAEAERALVLANGCDVIARHYQQVLGLLTGQPQPLTGSDVQPGETELGIRIALGRYAPPPDATDEQVDQFVEAMDRLVVSAIHQRQLAQDEQGRRWRAAERTGELPEAFLLEQGESERGEAREPDPLTATPAEESEARAELPPPAAAEPDAGDVAASPVGATHLGEGPSPSVRYVGQRVLVRAKDGTRSRGVLFAAGDRLVLEPCELGPPVVFAADVEAVLPVRDRSAGGTWRQDEDGRSANASTGMQGQRAYPDEPATGSLPVAESAARPVPPSHGADDPTQALPPVHGGAS